MSEHIYQIEMCQCKVCKVVLNYKSQAVASGVSQTLAHMSELDSKQTAFGILVGVIAELVSRDTSLEDWMTFVRHTWAMMDKLFVEIRKERDRLVESDGRVARQESQQSQPQPAVVAPDRDKEAWAARVLQSLKITGRLN